MHEQDVKHYKVKALGVNLRPNSVYYVKATTESSVKTYITDKDGNPHPLIDLGTLGGASSVTGTGVIGTVGNPVINIDHFISSDLGNLIQLTTTDGKLFVKPITSPDGSIDVVSTISELQIQLSVSLQGTISSALQPGDNISTLNNDAGYLTEENITAFSETPSGIIDGTNVIFTLTNTPPSPEGVIVILNGVVQYNNIDYTVFEDTITFIFAPAIGSSIFSYYGIGGGGGGGEGVPLARTLKIGGTTQDLSANRTWIWTPTKTELEEDDIAIIPNKHQQLIFGDLINDGAVVVDGELIFL